MRAGRSGVCAVGPIGPRVDLLAACGLQRNSAAAALRLEADGIPLVERSIGADYRLLSAPMHLGHDVPCAVADRLGGSERTDSR